MNANEKGRKTTTGMSRIQNVSAFVRVLILASLVIEGACMVAGLVVIGNVLLHFSKIQSQEVFSDCTGFLLLPMAFMLTLNFFRLFGQLKDGRLFELQTIKYLETAGKWWIALAVIQAIFQILHGFIFSNSKIVFTGNGIFGGLVVFFIAWVLREAQELKEEQELTV